MQHTNRQMSSEEISAWAAAFIRAQQNPELLKKEWWAVEKFMSPGSKGAPMSDCWKTILAVLAQDPPEKVISVLAAGPLEDLIDACGEAIITEVEQEARRNPAFKHLLGGVWEVSTKEIWARLEACRGSVW